jgi:hypothetical protein
MANAQEAREKTARGGRKAALGNEEGNEKETMGSIYTITWLGTLLRICPQ